MYIAKILNGVSFVIICETTGIVYQTNEIIQFYTDMILIEFFGCKICKSLELILLIPYRPIKLRGGCPKTNT